MPYPCIELLEWALPPTWRAKFDLDGYISTLESKSRLIEACETIECNKTIAENNDNKKSKKGKGKKAKSKNSGSPLHKEKVRGRKRNFLYRSWVQPYA